MTSIGLSVNPISGALQLKVPPYFTFTQGGLGSIQGSRGYLSCYEGSFTPRFSRSMGEIPILRFEENHAFSYVVTNGNAVELSTGTDFPSVPIDANSRSFCFY